MQARPQAGLQGSTEAHFLITLFILSLWDGGFCFCLPNLFSVTAHQNPLGKALLLFGQTDTATLPPPGRRQASPKPHGQPLPPPGMGIPLEGSGQELRMPGSHSLSAAPENLSFPYYLHFHEGPGSCLFSVPSILWESEPIFFL